MTKRVRMLLAWIFTIAIAATMVACASETTGPDASGDPPPLPPLTSMSVDFSLFDGAGGGPDGADVLANDAERVGANFTQAALRVLVAEVVAVAVLAVPTVTFGAALEAGAEYENGAWHWTTSATSEQGTWSVHLTGAIQAPDALWEMRLTSPPSFSPALDDFLWYAGVSKLDGSSGVWRIYDAASAGTTEVLQIDWTHVSPEEHGLVFEVTQGPGQGDSIRYARDGSVRTVFFYDASDGTTVEIGWDAETGEGYIIAPGWNGGARACWDGSQNDIACA